MAGRITRADLATLLPAVREAAVSAGVDEAHGWRLETGSKTYGRAYRLWLERPGETGHYSPIVRDFLGMTAGEAYDSLNTLRSAFLAVAWVRHDNVQTERCGIVCARRATGRG